MKIEFMVEGTPTSKFSKVNDVAWKILFQQEMIRVFAENDVAYLMPQEISLKFYFKAQQGEMQDSPFYNKPDIDNLTKNVLDICYGGKYSEFVPGGDQTIWKLSAEKRFSDTDSYTEITIVGIPFA